MKEITIEQYEDHIDVYGVKDPVGLPFKRGLDELDITIGSKQQYREPAAQKRKYDIKRNWTQFKDLDAQEFIRMRKAGAYVREIARHFKISTTTYYRVIREYEESINR